MSEGKTGKPQERVDELRTLSAVNQQLRALNQQVTASEQQLKAANQQLRAKEEKLQSLNKDLDKRVKELDYFYLLSQLLQQPDIALENIFARMVELMPPVWRYPDITCARVVFGGQEFKTDNFKQTQWSLSSDINIHGSKSGTVEVCYLKKTPAVDEGPFLSEERELIDTIASMLSEAVERHQAEEGLKASNQQLTAVEQQLTAANQQLKAQSQQLRATNQQLNAANQQLQASQQELAKDRNLLRTLIDNLPDVIYVKDTKSRFILGNTTAEHIMGAKTPDEFIGKTDADFYPQQLASQYHEDEQQIIKTGWPLINHEEKCIDQTTGSEVWLLTTKLPLKDSGGKIVGIVGIGRDITERRKAEEALIAANQQLKASNQQLQATEQQLTAANQQLKASNQQLQAVQQELAKDHNLLRTLIDNLPDVVYVKDIESRFILGNAKIMSALGAKTHDEFVGKSDADILPEDIASKYREDERQIIKTGQPLIYHDEKCTDHVTGEEIWISTIKLPLKDGSGKIIGTVGIGRDITESKKAREATEADEQKLRALNQQLRAGEKELTDNRDQLRALTSKLSSIEESERRHIAEHIHDEIIQPLVFLDIKAKSLSKTAKDKVLIESFGRMRTILAELIEKARSCTFDLSYPILYELGLESAIEEWLRTEIEEKYKITTEFKGDSESKGMDQSMITFLFKSVKELLVNVVKHASANNVKVSVAKEKNNMVICVEDNGCGFDSNGLNNRRNKLSGFGLFNIRERLTYLGGNLNIESKRNLGSKIILTVPMENEVSS